MKILKDGYFLLSNSNQSHSEEHTSSLLQGGNQLSQLSALRFDLESGLIIGASKGVVDLNAAVLAGELFAHILR